MKFLPFALPSLALAYCGAGNTVTGDSNLGAVTLMGDTKSIQDASNCPGIIGLRDLTNLVADISIGKQYVLNFQATTCDTGWQRLAYAYIDFNQNGVYDPDELVGQQSVDNRMEPFSVSFTFTTPPSPVGMTRMRVFVVESGFTPNPCLTFSYGGVKEFSIEITGTAPPTPGPRSCCLPSTYSSVSRVLGSQTQTIFTYQDWDQQAWLQRVELTEGVLDNAVLCLQSTGTCFAYTTTSCQKFSFVMPNRECPGQDPSKYEFQSQSTLVPGVVMTQWLGGKTVATTLSYNDKCVWNTLFPSTFYLRWDLEAPAASVFEIPAICRSPQFK